MSYGYKTDPALRANVVLRLAAKEPRWVIARETGISRGMIDRIARAERTAFARAVDQAVAAKHAEPRPDVDAREKTEGYPW